MAIVYGILVCLSQLDLTFSPKVFAMLLFIDLITHLIGNKGER